MNRTCTRADANQLLLDGSQCLAIAEQTGIRIDMDYCKYTNLKLNKTISRQEERFCNSDLGKVWISLHAQPNFNSPQQLKTVLKKLGVPMDKKTKKGNDSLDTEALNACKTQGMKDLLRLRKLQKAQGTYLDGIIREAVQHSDGLWYLHPFFHLNTVRTYRSSSSNINFQNIPTRDPEIKAIIRPAFIPRPGRVFMELDFKALEVGVAACYHKDPTMLEYLRTDPGAMHSDMARELFLMNPEDSVSKQVRHAAKNGFVFPEFYGDWFRDCAHAMWALRNTLDVNGLTLKQHFSEKGIKSYEAFEKLVEKAERRLWDERFPVYRDWKEQWWQMYLKRGWFDTLTGFRCSGLMGRNETINYPVQGSAFHCLLKTLIWCAKSLPAEVLLVGQIHDSGMFDLPEQQVNEWFEYVSDIVRRRLPQVWPWIIVPMGIDGEQSEVDGSWNDMKPIKEN